MKKMKKIIFTIAEEDTIDFSKIDESQPIFAIKDNELCGMVVKDPSGWILRLGGSAGSTGWHNSLQECIGSCFCHGYEFFVN